MPKMPYLKRRESGVYVVRLVVPGWLRGAAGQREVHRSTGCRDLPLARIVASEITAEWNRRLIQFRRMDPEKLTRGSVDLLGDGLLPLTQAASTLGASPRDLAQRLLRRSAAFYAQAKQWDGWLVHDLHEIYDERDALGNVVSIDVSDAALKRHGEAHRHTGEVRFAFSEEAIQIVETEVASEVRVFRFSRDPSMGLVLTTPVVLGAGDLLVRRSDVEGVRRELAAQMGEATAVTAGGLPTGALEALAAVQDSAAKHKYYDVPVSQLTAKYLNSLRGGVKNDELRRQEAACSALVELTDDKPLGKVDRDVVGEVADLLQRVPHRRHLVTGPDGAKPTSWRELIAIAERKSMKRLTPNSVERLVEDMQAVFAYGVQQGWLRSNPIEGLAGEVFDRMGGVRVQHHERRDRFSDEDLLRIFGAPWFVKGVGGRTAKGRFHSYRPYYYWLPLLGLFAGGRINELSQLYLSDVRQTENGAWYLDFNLDGDKIDADEGDPSDDAAADDAAERGHRPVADKSLKTVNAKRVVPLHSTLLELGFLEYVEALRGAGESRLFPELRRDKHKGYGKAASSWFNERFLGRSLKIERTGRKVFHSFRHNFATALERAEAPPRAVRQLMGHSLAGDRAAESAPGYKKSREAAELVPVIQLLNPSLPMIAKFRVADGLQAMQDARELKRAQRSPRG